MIKPPKPTRQETALSVIIVLCIVGFVGVVFAGLFIKQAGNDSLFGFLGFVFFAGLCLSNWMHKKCAQRSRDNYALYLLNATKAGEVSEFAVFLRPFYTTGKVKEKVVHVNFAGSSTPTTVTHNLEVTLIDALAMPVVALGEPGETYGAGRILENEDSWKGTVSELMPRASILICIPSGHPGTRWELDEIGLNRFAVIL